MDAAILEMDTSYTVTTDGSAVCANSTGEIMYLYMCQGQPRTRKKPFGGSSTELVAYQTWFKFN